ncbi:nitrophenyl compound nitroreductase subunit ArsF family protein [Marinifilum flexuosum]|uniref:nitrophenyl compound nitroreductase subunit ArsF family protein n=1 Tax=Marinifilum flexuosum TaxID=1117708 RepID=UPI0024943C56|nr:nitrophenyl compound nitroreductase subunit ArsF family protein [Marinifilum flexuosum]
MKKTITLGILALGLSFGACQSNTKKETACKGDCTKCEKTSETKVASNQAKAGVYYFHGDRKCKTCKAVGAKAKEVAASLNANFFDINFDQEENKELAKTFQASSSGLYIKSAKSGEIQDLTTFAFRNAINDTPAYIEKLETVIKAELQ